MDKRELIRDNWHLLSENQKSLAQLIGIEPKSEHKNKSCLDDRQ